jgi:hypothetical protein
MVVGYDNPAGAATHCPKKDSTLIEIHGIWPADRDNLVIDEPSASVYEQDY